MKQDPLKELKSCKDTQYFKAIAELKSNLQTVSFTNDQLSREVVRSLISQTGGLISQVDTMSTDSPCAIFYLANWDSIVGHLYNLVGQVNYSSFSMNTEEPVEYPDALMNSLTQLNHRLREKLTDPKSQSILLEGWSGSL